jgi:hypothetical protein
MCVIREPGPSSDEPTEIQREPHYLIDHSGFVGRTRVAHFSTEIATSTEVSPYNGGLGILAGLLPG